MIKIGITCDKGPDKYYLPDRYVQVLRMYTEKAGIEEMIPVILPLTDDKRVVKEYVKMFDGFFFTGGDDIDPVLYGEEKLPVCGTVDRARDDFELALCREVVLTGKPVLGICRGVQTINVALGGTLWQDIHSQVCDPQRPHLDGKDERGMPYHDEVTVTGWLGKLLGQEKIFTNSFHHQAVKVPGEELEICAVSRDGVVEAVRHRTLPYFVGYQWHPEMWPDEISEVLFVDFLHAVETWKREV